MALLPKKGENIGCILARDDSKFTTGWFYQVEKADRMGFAYVYDDAGNMTPIDFPDDLKYGKFEKVA